MGRMSWELVLPNEKKKELILPQSGQVLASKQARTTDASTGTDETPAPTSPPLHIPLLTNRHSLLPICSLAVSILHLSLSLSLSNHSNDRSEPQCTVCVHMPPFSLLKSINNSNYNYIILIEIEEERKRQQVSHFLLLLI